MSSSSLSVEFEKEVGDEEPGAFGSEETLSAGSKMSRELFSEWGKPAPRKIEGSDAGRPETDPEEA